MPYSDSSGSVYDYPEIESVYRTGTKYIIPELKDMIKLPYGSYLFSLPDRIPIGFDGKKILEITEDGFGEKIQPVSSFLASAYLRTYLPAYKNKSNPARLTLWAYAGASIINGKFHVPAIRIDDDIRSDPKFHENHEELETEIKKTTADFKNNRLVKQLARCSTEYNCLCARNFFLSRFEAPIPSSPSCNSDCAGCLSYQKDTSGFAASHGRLEFSPAPQEISEVIFHHFEKTEKNAIASFGQGCEGEPLLRADDLSAAVKAVRKKTSSGTININTNGSIPENVSKLIDSGIDSIRISLNSPTENYYNLYHNPKNYTFSDVKKSIKTAINAGIFVSLNLFFMPGFTDMLTEVNSLFDFLDEFPVNMIQTRNLNIDPDYYFEKINYKEADIIGILNLISMIKEKKPEIRLGYYNPCKEKFHIKP